MIQLMRLAIHRPMMRYTRCTLLQNNIPTWLIQTLNVLPGVNIGMQSMSA